MRASSRRETTLGVPVLATLGLLSAFGPIAVDLYLPALPAVTGDFEVSPATAQLTLSASVIGLAIGQLLVGPISDRWGRRPPVLVGMVVFAATSLACAAANDVETLVAFRLLQAVGGAAGLVSARAVARDLAEGAGLVRLMSLLATVAGVAPVCAPLVGSQMLLVTSWRGLFVVLAGVGIVLWVLTFLFLPDERPPRHESGIALSALGSYRAVMLDRSFMWLVMAMALGFAAFFTYVVCSPFLLQIRHGLSPQAFGVVFAVNAAAVVTGARLRRIGPERKIDAGLALMTIGAFLVAVSLLGVVELVLVLSGFVVICGGWGMVAPSGTALALQRNRLHAATAAAVLGFIQFGVAGAVSPLAGLDGPAGAVPAATTLSCLSVMAMACWCRANHTGRTT